MRYRPLLSDKTMTVIFVFAFRACTKAARNGAPSGPVTVPVMVAPYANEAAKTNAPARPRMFLCLNGCITPPLTPCHWRLHAGTETQHLQCRRGYQTVALDVYGHSPSVVGQLPIIPSQALARRADGESFTLIGTPPCALIHRQPNNRFAWRTILWPHRIWPADPACT